MPSGYSGTPLAKKLGIKEGFKVYLVNQPDHYLDLFIDLPVIHMVKRGKVNDLDFIHFFATTIKDLDKYVARLKSYLKKGGMMWVSWPKGSSKISTELNREIIRAYVLQAGLVDIKVAAIDEDWSGLKFVYRTKDR